MRLSQKPDDSRRRDGGEHGAPGPGEADRVLQRVGHIRRLGSHARAIEMTPPGSEVLCQHRDGESLGGGIPVDEAVRLALSIANKLA